MGGDGFQAIALLLEQEMQQLKSLNLNSTGMTDGHVEMIAESLKRNSKLENLGLGGSDKKRDSGASETCTQYLIIGHNCKIESYS